MNRLSATVRLTCSLESHLRVYKFLSGGLCIFIAEFFSYLTWILRQSEGQLRFPVEGQLTASKGCTVDTMVLRFNTDLCLCFFVNCYILRALHDSSDPGTGYIVSQQTGDWHDNYHWRHWNIGIVFCSLTTEIAASSTKMVSRVKV